MIFVEKINNKDSKDVTFYTGKYPLISAGFNYYYHSSKDKFEKIKHKVIEPYKYEYEELLNFKNIEKNKKMKFYIKPNDIEKFNNDKNSPELIVIDYECDNFNKNTLEMDIFPDVYEKILKVIELKCDIICKLYETFTFDSIKLISKLVKTYKNVYICKPLSSKLYNSEKFIICYDFLKDGDEIVNIDIFNQIKNLNIKTFNMSYIYLNRILSAQKYMKITTI